MHAVINHLPLQMTTDGATLSHTVDVFEATRRTQYPAFRGCTLIRAGDDAGILVVTFDTHEALDDISKNVAAPWFAEHVRSFGEVIAGSALREKYNNWDRDPALLTQPGTGFRRLCP